MAYEAKSSAPQQRRRFGPGRSPLRGASQERGRRVHNIWYHYSPRLKRDVVLRSDVAFSHFCWIEADPRVVRYELEPGAIPLIVGKQTVHAEFDILVELRDSPPELRNIGVSRSKLSNADEEREVTLTQAASNAGFRCVRITVEDLGPHLQLIRNWRYALAFQAACRNELLTPFLAELSSILVKKRECSLDELLEPTSPDLRSRYLAALFEGLQNARFESDMAAMPLCGATRLSIPGGAS